MRSKSDSSRLFGTILKSLKNLSAEHVFGFALIAGFTLATLIQIVSPTEYEIKGTIMPVNSKSDRLPQLVGLANLPLGLGEAFAENDLVTYKELLLTRSINAAVISACQALQKFPHKELEKAAEYLAKKLAVVTTKGGLLELRLRSELDPETGTCLVNQYIHSISEYLEEKGFDRAKSKRLFLAEQIELKRRELFDISRQLASFSESSSLVNLNSDFMGFLDVYGRAMNNSAKAEIELNFFRSFHPERIEIISSLEEKVKAAKDELANLNWKPRDPSRMNDTSVSFQKSPVLALQYAELSLRRQITAELLTLLNQQYEMTKMQEIETKQRFEMVDKALEPKEPVSPKFLLNLFYCLVGSALLAFLILRFRSELSM